MTLRSRKLMLLTLILLILMMLATPPLSLAQDPPTLSVDPPSGTMTEPTYTVDVKITHIDNLWAIHFQLSFNNGTDFLQVDIPEGVQPGDFSGPPETWNDRIDIGYGSVGGITYLDVTMLAPDYQNNGTITGEGTIAEVTFRLKENAEPEMTSWLKLELVDATIFTGEDFEPIQITLGSGYWVKVSLLTTTLTLVDVPSTASVEKPITLSAKLVDGGGNPITGQTIDFYVNSTKSDSDDTDTNGVASVTYTPTASGTLDVQAVYEGALLYAGSSSDTVQIAVSKMSTTTTIDVPLSIKLHDTVNLVATLKKDTAPTPTPIVGAIVNFSISPVGWTGSATTNSSGIASVTYTFEAVGIYGIVAEYLGTEKYAPSIGTATRIVASERTTLTPSKLLYSGKVDEPTTISAILKDENGNPLADFDIDFYIYKETTPSRIGTGTTNSSGIASIEYRPPVAGIFQIEAIFNGTLTYTASGALAGIVILPVETTLTLNVPAATVNKLAVITATLEDEDENPINGQPVQFYLDLEEIAGSPTTTNSSGIASIGFTPTVKGTFKVKAIFNGSAKYAGSSYTADLTVGKLASTLSLNVPASAKVEERITLTTVLKDMDGNPIGPYAIIDYEIFSIGWVPLDSFEVTNESGVASLDYVPTQAGAFKIRARYDGDEKHVGSTSEEITLTVNKVNTTLTISVPNNTTAQTSITISATLKDEYGNPLLNSRVYYYKLDNVTGGWAKIDEASTNIYGTASIAHTAPSNTGIYKFKATYSGDQKYAESTSKEATLEVTSGSPETPEEPQTPFFDFSFLLDANLTILDILFWAFLIMSFSTVVVFVIWKKTR